MNHTRIMHVGHGYYIVVYTHDGQVRSSGLLCRTDAKWLARQVER